MNANNTGKLKPETFLSTLWVFVTVNYIYCDVISLMNPADLKNILSGTVGNIQMNEGFLLGASIMMEIPLVMILLSRLLKYKINRPLNIIAGSLMTLVQLSSFFMGTGTTMHYIFFSTIEIACTAYIALYAFKWREMK